MSGSASIVSDACANPVVQGGDKRAMRSYELRLRDWHSAELIVVGVSHSKIAQSRFAKSGLAAGWADFKRMRAEKGTSTLEVCERRRSRSCSECGAQSASWPSGIAGLRKRMFASDDCGAVLDRDVNAARNIRRIGEDALAGGAHA